jgi:integrase
MRPRLKHRGEEVKAVREKYQRPKVRDEGNKWKIFYRDYSSGIPQRRSKTWMKSKVRTQREAQRLADQFLEEVNKSSKPGSLPDKEFSDRRDGGQQPHHDSSPANLTLNDLKKRCSELSWPLLKKPTRLNYEFFFDKYLLPAFGSHPLREINTMRLQVYFNSLLGKLSPYTICNMHAALRAALAQALAWDLADKNSAIGVKLPKKKPSKSIPLLGFGEIKSVIETLPDPTKSVVTLIVFASMRVGEALALRWNDILEDRIVIDERLYDGDLDDPKTINGNREVPLDQQGILKEALTRIWNQTKFRGATDFVFATRNGTPTERRNVLRHLKSAAQSLGLSREVDFRSFRTMHASLMRRSGARPEVARDNMGHSETHTTLEIYSKTWWDERAAAVSSVVQMVMNPENNVQLQNSETEQRLLFQAT